MAAARGLKNSRAKDLKHRAAGEAQQQPGKKMCLTHITAILVSGGTHKRAWEEQGPFLMSAMIGK